MVMQLTTSIYGLRSVIRGLTCCQTRIAHIRPTNAGLQCHHLQNFLPPSQPTILNKRP